MCSTGRVLCDEPIPRRGVLSSVCVCVFVIECDQVKQEPYAPIFSRQLYMEEVRIKEKSNIKMELQIFINKQKIAWS